MGIPSVSVILPTFNRGRLIGEAIASVLAQTFDDFELIVVDDCSADDTGEQVKANTDPRLRYVRHDTNRGAAAARNTGVKEAKAAFVAFQDSDDVWHKNKLEKQMDVVRRSGGDAQFVFTGMMRRFGGKDEYIPKAGVKQREGEILPDLLAENFISTQTILVSKEWFETVGGFDLHAPPLEDWELAIRLARRFTVHIVDEPMVFVQETSDSISRNIANFVSALEYIVIKHNDLYKEYPGIRSRQLAFIGHCLCAQGEMAKGRGYLRDAIRCGHKDWQARAALALSMAGPWMYKTVAHLRRPQLIR